MDLTVFEISCGVGAWIGIFCLIVLLVNSENNQIYASTSVKALVAFIIPVAIITFIYLAFQIGIMFAKILIWLLTTMFHFDILFTSFIIIMSTLAGLTIGNTIKLLEDKRKEEIEVEVEDDEDEDETDFKPKPNPFVTPID
jgi:hypothetical protein